MNRKKKCFCELANITIEINVYSVVQKANEGTLLFVYANDRMLSMFFPFIDNVLRI